MTPVAIFLLRLKLSGQLDPRPTMHRVRWPYQGDKRGLTYRDRVGRYVKTKSDPLRLNMEQGNNESSNIRNGRG
jgi:hypothetical protein